MRLYSRESFVIQLNLQQKWVLLLFFYESLQIAFPNNVLVIQFLGWSLVSAGHPTEERGGASRVISI